MGSVCARVRVRVKVTVIRIEGKDCARDSARLGGRVGWQEW